MNSPDAIVKNQVSVEMAVDIIERLYGMTVLNIEQMVSYDDRNFHVTISDDHRNKYVKIPCPDGYTLKISNAWKSDVPGYVDSIHSAMRHLEKNGLRLPQPIKNLRGDTWSFEEIPVIQRKDGGGLPRTMMCAVHMLTYLPGVPIGTVSYTPNILWQWGNLLARFHKAAKDFSHEAIENKPIFWNLINVPRVEDFMEGLDNAKVTLVQEVLEKYAKEIPPAISSLPKGHLHGDFNENNILVRKMTKVNENGSQISDYSVDGILDLEDMHYGTYVWDVGLMLAYVTLECTTMDPVEGMGYALAGYLEMRPFSENEVSLLKICIVSRLIQSLVLGAYSHKLEPDNSYLTNSAKFGWARLEQVWKTSDNELVHKFKLIARDFYNGIFCEH